jgi:hypothetical protein
MWNLEPLQGNDREVNTYTTGITIRKQACFRGNNFRTREEWTFLRGPSRGVLSRTAGVECVYEDYEKRKVGGSERHCRGLGGNRI